LRDEADDFTILNHLDSPFDFLSASRAGMDLETARLHQPPMVFHPLLFLFKVCQDFVAASIEAAARTTSFRFKPV
jgi:hypothetical protein